MSRAFAVVLAAYSDAMVEGVCSQFTRFLRPGDEVDLVSGNHDRPLALPDLGRWVSELTEALSEEVALDGHTSGLANVAQLAAGAPERIRAILLDYEPNWDPEFTWDLGATQTHFERFAEICRAHGRRAIAYPTGRPLLEPSLQVYGWDYAELARHVDDLYPQTQHWASPGPGRWAAALEKLRGQRSALGRSPRDLTLQLTLGDRLNGITARDAMARVQEAATGGLSRLFLWWAPSSASDVLELLTALNA